ncbi:AsmA-like C-terminal region-containing protein [Elioraea sp.]|uniref:YhdP family protein n=1 Tax=Elioraea sp. TaxID=2185103 RepID=UPI0025BD0723|nr:AsmA-like C-terminal region-containing protein [Elioraea sp.]
MIVRSLHLSGHFLRWLGVITLTLLMLGAAAIGGLAWRLSQGPLPLDPLARMMEAHVNREGGDTTILIGGASLVWEGFDAALDRPLDIRLADVRLIDPAGVEIAALPEGQVSLGLRALLLGRFEPRAIDLTGVRIAVFRREDGSVALDLGPRSQGPPPTEQEVSASPIARAGAILEELGLAPGRAGAAPPRFARLQLVRVRGAELDVDDRQLGARWAVPDLAVLLRREPDGAGTALAIEASGRAQAQGVAIALRLRGRIGADGAAEAELGFDPVVPSAIASALPGLGVLAAVSAPISGTVNVARAEDGTITAGGLRAILGAGGIHIPDGGVVPVRSATITARYTQAGLTVDEARIVLPGTDGPSPTVRATARAVPRDDGSWALTAEATVDALAASDLPRLWAEGIGGNEREWITRNITAGLARDARFTLRATVPATLDSIAPEAVDGTVNAEGLTVHYLRPMPPVEGVSARMRLGLAQIDIATRGGRLGAITVPEGTIRLHDLDRRPNMADIRLRIATPVADALALLGHPKLDLIGRRGAPPPGITGTGEVTLAIGFPLIAELTMDQLAVTVAARAQEVKVPAILAGRDLDRGVFELSADPAGLRLSGTGAFGAIAADIRGELDFRGGPATQVVERFSVKVAPQERIDALFDLDLAPYLTGPVAAEAVLETRRNGQGTATVRADLATARLAVPELGLEKSPGSPGSADARLTLVRGRLTAAEVTRLEAGDITGRARFGIARDGRLDRIEVPDARLGASRVSGTVRLPQGPSGNYAVTLRAPLIDVSRRRETATAQMPSQAQEQGPGRVRPVAVEAVIDRLIVSPGHELAELRGNGIYARGVIARAEITGKAGERGSFRASVTPEGTKRALSMTADDAGALLNGIDVITTMAGGRLTVHGSFDDAVAGSPLTGEAEILDFRMREAPAAARVLQAMTLYGVLDLARGPGLSFNRAVASFTLTDGALDLRDARAFGASLGFTAKGRIDRRQERIDLEGTIVPAYFFNSLLGSIPLIGRIFSPEQGGGLFAATYRVRGPLNDPEASVNPLAALTPGFLRGLFGIFEGSQTPSQAPSQAPGQPPAQLPPVDIPDSQRGG